MMLCSRRSFSALGNESLLHLHFSWMQAAPPPRRVGAGDLSPVDAGPDARSVPRVARRPTVRLHRVSPAGQPLVRRRRLGRRGIQFDRGFRPSQRDVFTNDP